MKETELRFRQIHLDFHTSEFIESIGSNFDPDQFAETLVKANVNSITCFARCHHGWLYFNSKAFPERRHPQLQKELLPRQIEACHRRGIRVPIDLTVQWDHYTATSRPEWVAQDAEGTAGIISSRRSRSLTATVIIPISFLPCSVISEVKSRLSDGSSSKSRL